jgi:hypothetical protein
MQHLHAVAEGTPNVRGGGGVGRGGVSVYYFTHGVPGQMCLFG